MQYNSQVNIANLVTILLSRGIFHNEDLDFLIGKENYEEWKSKNNEEN